MALNLSAARFTGPALPEPFVKFDLEKILNANGLLPKNTGEEGKKLKQEWDTYRRWLRSLGANSGRRRVLSHVIEPLLKPELLGYSAMEESEKVTTREGEEDGGFILKTADGVDFIRVWPVDSDTDLESPVKRGHAYRYSYVKIAQRVLLASKEKIGIITDGQELRILLSDSARPDSQVIISMNSDWRRAQDVPDTFRFLLALTCPKGLKAIQEITDKARLKQSTITKELRTQARRAIESFIQFVLDDPQNKAIFSAHPDKDKLAKELWHEGLVIVYRLLFILKGEATDDPAKAFRFTGAKIWRSTYSPTTRLARHVRKNIDEHSDTGTLISTGLKTIFKMFEHGVTSSELNINPLAGTLFEEKSTLLLSAAAWPEKGCAILLDKLLWTNPDKKTARQRIHYGSLDVEDLGRVYEALLELEPGIAKEPMCRLRRAKLEIVVPASQGEKYKATAPSETDGEAEEAEEEELSKGTPILWIEEIKQTQFYLRVGLGRKATGSYYTPHSFVRFLVQETLGAKIEEVSPKTNPFPNKILQLKVIDPAMGSGHFLVEACRFIGDKLYEAVRLCDEKAMNLEKRLGQEKDPQKHKEIGADIEKWRNRILEIPDPDDEILAYLPSRAPEDGETGFSQNKAMALCKRLAAVHCLYGADKNPLAVELAKLSLWLESQSEGLPLTFLDHRLVVGDSITGPFFEDLLKNPSNQEPIDGLFAQGLIARLVERLKDAIAQVHEMEKSVGISTADIQEKRLAKSKLEEDLLPFKVLAAAWAGLIMLGADTNNDHLYSELLRKISSTGKLPETISNSHLILAIAKGMGIEDDLIGFNEIINRARESRICSALSFDLTFPEVFFKINNEGFAKTGFDVVLGNPPWKSIDLRAKDFFASYNLDIIAAPTKAERETIQKKLLQDPQTRLLWDKLVGISDANKKALKSLYHYVASKEPGVPSGANPDIFSFFVEKSFKLMHQSSQFGMLVPAGIHYTESCGGIRSLILNDATIKHYYCFINKKDIFEDIGATEKFIPLVFHKDKAPLNHSFPAKFKIEDENFIFNPSDFMVYTKDFIAQSGGKSLTFVELLSKQDLEIVLSAYKKGTPFGEMCKKESINLAIGFDMTKQSHLFEAITRHHIKSYPENLQSPDIALLHEGKTMFQFTDLWDTSPRYVIPFSKLPSGALKAIPYFRLIHRAIVGFTIEKSIFALVPPKCICGNSLAIEGVPKRANSVALTFLAVLNSYIFNWLAKLKTDKNMNSFVLDSLPFNTCAKQKILLAHLSLRLVANHKAFEVLWKEQLSSIWREPNKEPFTWPVLLTNAERWEVRSIIDATVADAYGLRREQYQHVLRSFDRPSGPNPYTDICLAKFDELKAIGFDAFTKKYDPYWDIPLNESLPKPIIDLPIVAEPQMELFYGVSEAESDGAPEKTKRSKNK